MAGGAPDFVGTLVIGGVVGVPIPIAVAATVGTTAAPVFAVEGAEVGRDEGMGVIIEAETLLFTLTALAGITRVVVLVVGPATGVDATADEDEPEVVEARAEAARRGVGPGAPVAEGAVVDLATLDVVVVVVVGRRFLGEAAMADAPVAFETVEAVDLIGVAAVCVDVDVVVVAVDEEGVGAGPEAAGRVGRAEERSGNETAIG